MLVSASGGTSPSSPDRRNGDKSAQTIVHRSQHGSHPSRRRHDFGPPVWLSRWLRRYGVVVRRSLGQNFLIDHEVFDRIIAAAALQPDDLIVDIGAGTGELTERLASRAGRVLAIEVDERLVALLRDRFAERSNIEIVVADVREADMRQLTSGHPYRVVANLPYYLATMALRRLLESDHPPRDLILMVQREVGQRLVARRGEMSLLGVATQVYAEAELLFEVPASAFFPSPDVTSAVVHLTVRPTPLVPHQRDEFFMVVSAGFANPRKQIHNSIPRLLWLPSGAIDDLLAEARIDPKLRAQDLAIDDWIRLRDTLMAHDLLKA